MAFEIHGGQNHWELFSDTFLCEKIESEDDAYNATSNYTFFLFF